MRKHASRAGREKASEFDRELSGLGRACVVAVLGGISIGVVGAAFRAGLAWVGAKNVELVQWAHAWPWLGWLIPVLLGALGAGLARLMVRRHPLAAGSGVQHVEAIAHGEAEPAPLMVVPIKFVGGLIGIGAGLALGREGPTIQMGATIGAELARRFRCAKIALQEVQAALGGAGLAVAFNAPIGGMLFVFEEVAREFRLRLTVLALVSTVTAIAVARTLLGSAADFQVGPVEPSAPWTLVLFLVFGGLAGLLGVFYNRTTIFCIDAMASLRRWPTEIRAAAIGALVGSVAWFWPSLVGGGDGITQNILSGGVPLGMLFLVLGVRWVIAPLSYAAGTPGGLFSPLLLVGAVLGGIFAMGCNALLPASREVSVIAFAIVGMTAFFTGVVRAPLTGIVLIAEMTATTTLVDAMLAAVFGAMLTSSVVRGEPIYETLRGRLLAGMPQRGGTIARPKGRSRKSGGRKSS